MVGGLGMTELSELVLFCCPLDGFAKYVETQCILSRVTLYFVPSILLQSGSHYENCCLNC